MVFGFFGAPSPRPPPIRMVLDGAWATGLLRACDIPLSRWLHLFKRVGIPGASAAALELGQLSVF